MPFNEILTRCSIIKQVVYKKVYNENNNTGKNAKIRNDGGVGL